ncbi:aryl-alcohol-oxidase from pleurotus Eryingii [Trametes maxima]|nr:aryl-alcohol-oxidase from pleurotus Eryingii [Trametes maxima]
MSLALSTFILVACIVATRAALYTNPADIPFWKTYDYVVVGSGPGGSAVAARLSEDPRVNVLVIEAGVRGKGVVEIDMPLLAPYLLPSSPFDWNYTTIPQPGLDNRNISYNRGKVLGGSSKLNWMAWTRGPRDDYDRFAKYTGDEGWSWDSILPLWQKIERLVAPVDHHNVTGEVDPSIHGLHGAVNISLNGARFPTDRPLLDAATELGGEFGPVVDNNAGNPLGLAWAQCSIGGGSRHDAATSYIEPILSRHNLDVLVGTQVTKLIRTGHDGDHPVVRGVQFAQSRSGEHCGPKHFLTAAREVILSAGSVNTPHLLLLSGIGSRSDLESFGIPSIINLPDVGQHLIDHIAVSVPFAAAKPEDDALSDLARNATYLNETLAEWQTERRGIGTNSVLGIIQFLRIPETNSIFLTHPDPSSGPTAPHIELLPKPGTYPFLGPVPSEGAFTLFTAALVSPTSRGSVTLSSNDPFTQPLINPNFLSTAFDVAALRYAVRSVQRFVSASAWKGFITGPTLGFEDVHTDDEVDAWARQKAFTVWHPVGTARMAGCEAAEGVVNPDLTVKGVKGLRVVDASVFPFIPAGHTQAVVYAFAERAAELIKNGRSSC